jgi:hypothetical protein
MTGSAARWPGVPGSVSSIASQGRQPALEIGQHLGRAGATG